MEPELDKQYKIAVYGKSHFTAEEWAKLSIKERQEIHKKNYEAQKEINLLKQRRLIEITDKILDNILKQYPQLAKGKDSHILFQKAEPDEGYFCKDLTFKDLGISKKNIAAVLINKKII